mmetsp:Transcript_15331/g.37722  ORF Transcript_15331/g.37722 Transcript_15331/m.37722 type:complete len:711 (-) Transcript_15331:379-2511(-)
MPSVILMLCQLGLISAFQQSPSVHSLSHMQHISPHRPTACLWSAAGVDHQTGDLMMTVLDEEPTTQVNYDWDEQFEELLAFKAKYDHCNFPQNAPAKLTEKYPRLGRFCRDQRLEYKRWRSRENWHKMTLPTFDRDVRYRRLKEIGFEFNEIIAPWYDHYHELVQYRSDNGHILVSKEENVSLLMWIRAQRCRYNGMKGYTRLSKAKIELMDNIGFSWESDFHYSLWHTNYNELVAFRKKHGHLLVHRDTPLFEWMSHQQQRRAGKNDRSALSDEQIRLLDDIEFPWTQNRNENNWDANYNELVRFQKEHGHCQVHPRSEKMYSWTRHQRMKHKKGKLSKEAIQLLDKIGFPWEEPSDGWNKLQGELIEYVMKHGHLRVSREDDPKLYDWMEIQRQRYHGIVEPALSPDQIEKLEQTCFCWSLDWRDRTWHEKYTEIVEFFKEHDHVRVIKKDNPSLYNWIQTQGKRYKEMKGQKPLSKEELELLEQVDFPFLDNQPRVTWNAMYSEVKRYRKENDGRFPDHNDAPDLNRWIRQQRNRNRNVDGYLPLSDEQRSLLEKIDFPMMHESLRMRLWYERYDELVAFWKQHGHFLVSKSDNPTLYRWIYKQRMRYKGAVLSSSRLLKSEIDLLERIDFPWESDREEVMWQMRYDELVQFVEEHGHLRVPRKESASLDEWILYQRQRYKGNGNTELSEHQIKQLEKIGFRWSGLQ